MTVDHGPMFYPGTMQDPQELAWFQDIIRGKGSMLEIGSATGGNLTECGKALRPRSNLYSIDVAPSRVDLYDAIIHQGHETFVCPHGSSQNPDSYLWAKGHGPFDVVFIDGDHSYEVCMCDWLNYGPLGTIVAFHDIAGSDERDCSDVKAVWGAAKVRAVQKGWKTMELIANPDWMGIGVIIKHA